jgi:type IV pilus assembly protein PilY1
MNFSRSKMLALSAVAVLAAGGYYMISADAVQGQGELAQAPLSTTSQVAPAFIMAVDDSNSMRFQAMFPAANGGACWDITSKSFFAADGSLRKTGSNCNYFSMMANPATADYSTTWLLIPPVDEFGFARAPEFNPSYFDPSVKYLPWLKADGTSYPNASITATQHDPRNTTPTIKLAAQYDGLGEGDRAALYTGMTLPAGTRYTTATGASTSSSWQTAPAAGYTSTVTNRSVWVSYWPATFFLKWHSETDPYPSMEGDATVEMAFRNRPLSIDGGRCHRLCGIDADEGQQRMRQRLPLVEIHDRAERHGGPSEFRQLVFLLWQSQSRDGSRHDPCDGGRDQHAGRLFQDQ